MGFAEIYREERLLSRRARARKARIAGRIIGFGLTLCFVALLRTEPVFRAAMEDLALAAVAGVMGAPAGEEAVLTAAVAEVDAAAQDATAGMDPTEAAMPASVVKVNRGLGG